MSALRIALLAPCFWPEVRRGGERLVRDLADGLIARGHRPRLVTSHPGRPRRSVEDGLEVLRLWRPPSGRLRRRGFEDHLTHVPLSHLALRRGADDVAHATYPTDALAAARWSRETGRPSVFACLGAPDRAYLASRRRRVDAWLAATRGCDAVTVLSDAAARSLHRALGVEARVVRPGVDLERFSPGAGRSEEPAILCVSALEDPMKRVGLLLEAFGLVRRERPNARLLLDRPRDPALAARAGEVTGVELLPLGGDQAALVAAYRRAWVTALPSLGEAFGLVLLESLACGTPGVGARAGGIPEVLDRPDVGRLFDGDDPEPLARALLEGLELSAAEGTAAACRARAAELSLDRCAAEHEALYRELIAARS